MHHFHDIKTHILSVIADLQAKGELPDALPTQAITVEPPRDPSHGDMATNAAMVLAKPAKMNPRALAEMLVPGLEAYEGVAQVDIAGPGFINLRFVPSFWQAVIPEILTRGTSFGDTDIGAGQKINVEYVSANPTGPLHIGHARGAIYGDALCLLLEKAGYAVTKEYYINDAGVQIETLARSVHLRYREACGETIEIPEGLYPGEYLKPVGEGLKTEFGDGLLDKDETEWLAQVKPFAITQMMNLIREDLAELGIHHEVFISEQEELHDKKGIEHTIERLKQKNLIYRGVLEPPKGKKPDDWEEREQLLFKSTDFGDDVDRALQKPDGSYTYFAADLAYAQHKIERGFHSLVYMLGADHGGYKKRIEAAIGALSDGKVEADIKLCQLVHLLRGGEPVKMSKRAGNFETVRDVTEAVGRDVLRFVMLTRKNDMVMEFDLEKVKEQSKDNPVFYVQYAHARAKSVLRLAEEQAPEALEHSRHVTLEQLAVLDTPAELQLLKQLAGWPRIVEAAATAHEPHRIAFYLQELAAAFHGLWNVGHNEQSLRLIVPDNPELTTARLALAQSLATVVASGLEVLGVTPLDELR